MLYFNISIMYILCLHGHPNQSAHITSPTAKCKMDANSEGPDMYNLSFRKLICTTTVDH